MSKFYLSGLIECGPDKKSKKFLSDRLETIETVRKSFEEEANKREIRKREYLERIKDQVIKKLEWAKRGRSERFKSQTDRVIGLLREAKLTLKQKRELRKIRSKYGLMPEELIQEVGVIVENCQKEEPLKFKRKYAQVIISEFLY